MSTEIQEGRRRRDIKPHRIILTLGVIVALGWFFTPNLDELLYDFSSQELLDLGEASSIARDKVLPLDRWVVVSGILGNKAATLNGMRPGSLRRGPIQVRQLLGTPIFVEFDQKKYAKKYEQFTQVTVEGRLADFGPKSEMGAVRSYFWKHHRMALPDDARLLIVDEVPGKMTRYPVALVLCLLSLIYSLLTLFRSFKVQIVDDQIN